MASSGNLLDYGIAVNFFGNYRQEGNTIQAINQRINSSLTSLSNLFIGGSVAYGFQSFMGKIISTGKQMEMQFAQIKGVLGDVGRTMETLQWAKMKGMTTSLSDTEVTDAVVSMVRMGLARDQKERNKNFDALADFTAMYLKPKGFSFSDAVDMVSKASFGNWERLGDNFGIRKKTIGTQWQSAQKAKGVTSEETSLTKYTEADITRGNQLLKVVKDGKQGTDEYKQSLVELLGLMSKGGMAETLNTFTGVMSNLMEIPEGFFKSLVGYAQVSGSLWNAVVTQMQNFFGVLTQKSEDGQTALGNFFRFAEDVGRLFTDNIKSSGEAVTSWAREIRNYLLDYENNIAPIILFLYLVKLQVMDFLSAFWGGFKPVFMGFVKLGIGVYKVLGDIAMAMGLGGTKAQALGYTLGAILGILLGIKAFKLITSPLQPLISGARTASLEVLRLNRNLYQMSMDSTGALRPAIGAFDMFKDNISRMVTPLMSASGASWSFTASLLANPITWIVIAVIALVAWLGYLIYNWDEVQKSMQGVSDIALVLLSIFMPIVGIPLLLAKYWDEFSEIFYNIWRGIRGYLLGSWLWINRTVIIPLKNAFVSIWTSVKTAVSGFINMVFDKFPPIRRIFEGIATIWNGIKDTISWIWDKIVNSDFVSGILDIVTSVSDAFGDGGEKFLAEQNAKNKEKADITGDKQYNQYYYKPLGDYKPVPKKEETPAQTNHNYSGATFNFPNVQNPNDFSKELQNMAGRK